MSSRLFLAAPLAIAFLGESTTAQDVVYAYRRDEAIGLALVRIEREGGLIAEQRALMEGPEGAAPAALCMLPGKQRVVVALRRRGPDNVFDVRIGEDCSAAMKSSLGVPRQIVSLGSEVFLATEFEVCALLPRRTEDEIDYQAPIGTEVVAIAAVPASDCVLVACRAEGRGKLIALAGFDLQELFDVDLDRRLSHPDLVALAPDGIHALVGSTKARALAVIDARNGELIAKGESPLERIDALCSAGDTGSLVYGFSRADGGAVVLDGLTGKTVLRFDAGGALSEPVFLSQPDLVVGLDAADGRVRAMSLPDGTRMKEASVDAPGIPRCVAAVSRRDCPLVLVSGVEEREPVLALIDPATKRVRDTQRALGHVLSMCAESSR